MVEIIKVWLDILWNNQPYMIKESVLFCLENIRKPKNLNERIKINN